MDPLVMIMLPGVLGGLVVAWMAIVAGKARRRDEGEALDAAVAEPGSADIINISHIRVAGLGGLGLVVMALVVAWFLPRVGQTLLIGAVAGIIMAGAMILYRRRSGPMPSSGRHARANGVLAIDEAPRDADATARDRSTLERSPDVRPVVSSVSG